MQIETIIIPCALRWVGESEGYAKQNLNNLNRVEILYAVVKRSSLLHDVDFALELRLEGSLKSVRSMLGSFHVSTFIRFNDTFPKNFL